jgi:hypothetical protein
MMIFVAGDGDVLPCTKAIVTFPRKRSGSGVKANSTVSLTAPDSDRYAQAHRRRDEMADMPDSKSGGA